MELIMGAMVAEALLSMAMILAAAFGLGFWLGRRR